MLMIALYELGGAVFVQLTEAIQWLTRLRVCEFGVVVHEVMVLW